MSKYILKYKRGEEVKYISHLDFVRFIQRVIRRADLPMSFSQGFNPHPIMMIALPLSVGVTADGELMRIGFEEDFEENYLKDTINKALPKGFEIVDVKKTEGKETDFNDIDKADYICVCETNSLCGEDMEAFAELEEIKVMKKSKSGIKEADIKPHIHSLEIIESDDNSVTLKMRVDAGNKYNLKPDTVIEAIQKYRENVKIDFFKVHRSALIAGDKELI